MKENGIADKVYFGKDGIQYIDHKVPVLILLEMQKELLD